MSGTEVQYVTFNPHERCVYIVSTLRTHREGKLYIATASIHNELAALKTSYPLSAIFEGFPY